jgi:DNA invertase Pin-like site-specific DNA recombinase
VITWVSGFEPEGIGLKRRHDVLETTSPNGTLTFHIFAALAAFARLLMQERTQAGQRAVSARGRVGGRPKA